MTSSLREIRQPGDYQYTFGPYAAPVAWVARGETVVVYTIDAFGDKLTSESQQPSSILGPYLNPQTGPIYVEGAEPGDTLVVTIEAAPEVIGLLADYIPDGAPTVEAGDRIRTTLRVSHYHGLKRLIAGMPGTVRVVAPEQARRAVAEWAAAGLSRYA